MFTIGDKAGWFKKKKWKTAKNNFLQQSIDHISSSLYKWSYGKYSHNTYIYL